MKPTTLVRKNVICAVAMLMALSPLASAQAAPLVEEAAPWIWHAVAAGAVEFTIGKIMEAVPEALSGSAEEDFNKGLAASKGQTKQDKEVAAKYFLKAARRDYSPAQLAIAYSYYKGEGVGQDYAAAIKWYEAAAKHQDLRAEFALAKMYYEGIGIPRPSHAKAAELCESAATGGHTAAQVALGYLFEVGDGVAQDYPKAAYWYRRAAENNHSLGQEHLASMLLSGYASSAHGVSHNDEEAVQLLLAAASQGLPVSQARLGWAYKTGRGIAQDDSKAREWYGRAAKNGYSYAQYYLADYCERGVGGPVDELQALQLYRLAKDNKDGHLDSGLREEAERRYDYLLSNVRLRLNLSQK